MPKKDKKINQKRTARKKLFRYVHRNLGYNLHGLSLNQAIKIFCEFHKIELPIGVNIKKWLYDLYDSEENDIIRREEDGFYGTSEWRKLRLEVLNHYGCKCMKCGFESISNCVDHIKPKSKYPELKLEFSNMQVLCSVCNLIKGDRNSIDYRPNKYVFGLNEILRMSLVK